MLSNQTQYKFNMVINNELFIKPTYIKHQGVIELKSVVIYFENPECIQKKSEKTVPDPLS